MCGQMMFIKKWPKLRTNNVLLTITQKCKHCKTVVEIDDLNDLEYAGKFSLEGGSLFGKYRDHRYDWKYECPYCGKKESLSDKNLDYITDFIDSNCINMKPYEVMEFISFKGDAYSIFYALWLHDKFGIQIHPSLIDKDAAEFYNKNLLGELLTNDGWFVNESEFDHILENLTRQNSNDKEKDILKDVIKMIGSDKCERITKVMHCRDAEGRTNYCILTNGPYCILLTMGLGGNDEIVINTKVLPRNYADGFYSRNPAIGYLIK